MIFSKWLHSSSNNNDETRSRSVHDRDFRTEYRGEQFFRAYSLHFSYTKLFGYFNAMV
jgi:hypothetical protein